MDPGSVCLLVNFRSLISRSPADSGKGGVIVWVADDVLASLLDQVGSLAQLYRDVIAHGEPLLDWASRESIGCIHQSSALPSLSSNIR
jgi:hypothetical protein